MGGYISCRSYNFIYFKYLDTLLTYLSVRDYLPEPPDVLVKGGDALHDLTVDTMVLTGDIVLWLHIGHQSHFRSKGHYPVLAAVAGRGRYFVAAVKVQHIYYFTYVGDGASLVVYKDEIGDEHTASEFYVLARRHRDDLSSLDALVWREFWPRRDPYYRPISDSAKQDDDHLEALLKSFNRVSSAMF